MNALVETNSDKRKPVFFCEDVLYLVSFFDASQSTEIASNGGEMMLAIELDESVEFFQVEIEPKWVSRSWVSESLEGLLASVGDISLVEKSGDARLTAGDHAILMTACRASVSLVVVYRGLVEHSVAWTDNFYQRMRSVVDYSAVVIFGSEVGSGAGYEGFKPFITPILKATLLTSRALEMVTWCNLKASVAMTFNRYLRPTVDILDAIIPILIPVNFNRSVYELFSTRLTASPITVWTSMTGRVCLGQLCKTSVFRAPDFNFLCTFSKDRICINVFGSVGQNTLVNKLFSSNMQGNISHASIYLVRS